MKIVEPWIKVEKIDGIKIMKRIERACRTCYRSEGNITEDSYKNLLKNEVLDFSSDKNVVTDELCPVGV